MIRNFFQVGYLLGRPPDGWYFSLYKFQAFHKAKNFIFRRFIWRTFHISINKRGNEASDRPVVWKNILYKSVVIYNRVFFIFKSGSGALSKLSLVNHIMPRPHANTSTCKLFFMLSNLSNIIKLTLNLKFRCQKESFWRFSALTSAQIRTLLAVGYGNFE